MTPNYYIDECAPSPVNNSIVPTTVSNLLRSVVANGLAVEATKLDELPSRRPKSGAETPRQKRDRWAPWLAAFYEMTAAHDLYLALSALAEVSPDKAQEVAERIVDAYEAGDSYGEWLYEWANGLGLDAERIWNESLAAHAEWLRTADDPAAETK